MIAMTLDEIAAAVGGRPIRAESPVPRARVLGVSVDSRTVRKGDVFFAIPGERFDGHDFLQQAMNAGAVGCIVSQVPQTLNRIVDAGRLSLVADTVSALGRLATLHREKSRARVVAVTGSNGKTTTKCMIEHVLGTRLRGRGAAKSFNNQIGLPLTLLSAESNDQFLVVEIGSNAPGEVAQLGRLASPDVGVVTSIGKAHLSGFGNLAGVRAEKLSLFETVRDSGLCVAPSDGLEKPIRPDTYAPRSVITFGAAESADVRVTDVSASIDHLRFRLNLKHEVRLPVAGAHNATNAAAAFAVCRRFRLEPEEILSALATFQLPDMRLTRHWAGGVTVFDDSYNANPSSMSAALATLAGVRQDRRVFVAGDMLELGDESESSHAELGRQIAEAGIEVVVGVGPHSAAMVAEAQRSGSAPQTLHYANTEDAAADLPARLRPGDTVLVKGSRRIGLDRLVVAICKELQSGDRPVAAPRIAGSSHDEQSIGTQTADEKK